MDGAFAECGPGGSGEPEFNGISVLELGEAPRLVGSTALSTFIGPALPEGAEHRVRWSGHLRLSDSRLAMLATVFEICHSVKTCEALGIEPRMYEVVPGGGAPSCGAEGNCPASEPQPQEPYTVVEGSRSSEWLVPLDLSDPTDPQVGDPVQGGLPDRIDQELYRHGVAPWLLGEPDADLFAYPSLERLYDDSGNSLLNEHGHAMERHFVQFFEATPESLSFTEAINVPGAPLLTGPAKWANDGEAERSVFTLGDAYDETGEPFSELSRLSIRNGGAFVTELLALPQRAYSAVQRGSRIALLSGPLDYCAEEAQFELYLVNVSDDQLSLSEPLQLNGGSWGWHLADWAPQPADVDTLHLFGGPAQNNGRAVVNVSGDEPELVRYERFEW